MRELSQHILDLVQNSIEAGGTQVTLEINEDMHNKDIFMIRVTDNGRGMDEETCVKVLDPFVTTRTTRRVGLGLPLIQMTTKGCGGYLKILSTVGSGTVVEALYQHSHWDRPPLGNIVETIKAIIVVNPEMDFTYRHTVDQVCFSITTQEVVNILGDISLTHPEVLIWLHEYLTFHVMNLYGGVSYENT